jgi:hypothetical protein
VSYGSQDWHSHRPVTKVGPRLSYLTLPAFSGISVEWRGAGEIVRQYTYAASGSFALLGLPLKPAFESPEVSFTPCIKYRVGSTVYRYRLWETDLDAISGIIAPVYNGELIRANFCIEIWGLLPQSYILGNEEHLDGQTYYLNDIDPTGKIIDIDSGAGSFQVSGQPGQLYYYTVEGILRVAPDALSTTSGQLVNYTNLVAMTPELESDIQIVTGIRSLPTYPYSMARQAHNSGTAVTRAELTQSMSVIPISFGTASAGADNA